jgi:hypothetical protein
VPAEPRAPDRDAPRRRNDGGRKGRHIDERC